MLKFVGTAKQILWEFVELSFLLLLALVLLGMLLGQNGGSYVTSVVENVSKFGASGGGGVLGIVIVVAIIYLVLRRTNWPSPSRK